MRSVGVDGATLLLFVGDEDVLFFQDRDELDLELGVTCSTSNHSNACNTTFPVTCLIFENATDDTIYACDGNVTGRVFLEYVPVLISTDASGDNLI